MNLTRTLSALIVSVLMASGLCAEHFLIAESRKRAEQGNALDQSAMGSMYSSGGEGVTKDYAEAVRWWRKAALQGEVMAQNSLGEMYQVGWGVTKDYAEAAKWFRKAAEQGHARAQTNLGFMYANGQGVRKDTIEAYAWLKLGDSNGISRTNNFSALKKGMLPAAILKGENRAKELTKEIEILKEFEAKKKAGNPELQRQIEAVKQFEATQNAGKK